MEKGARILVPKFKDECLLSKGIEIKDLLRMKKKGLLFVKPCISERGKLMADIELHEAADRFFDPHSLCSLLEIYHEHFEEFKCSSNLGVAKLKWKGHEISIFKNGKLKIQRASNREEILQTANSVSRLLWGSALCGVCGQPTVSCASGYCGKCTSKGRTVVQLGWLPNVESLRRGYSNLRKARKVSAEKLKSLLRETRCLALRFTVDAKCKEDAILGLILLGEAERTKVDPVIKPH